MADSSLGVMIEALRDKLDRLMRELDGATDGPEVTAHMRELAREALRNRRGLDHPRSRHR
jgi:hypothetical protein